MTDPFTARRRQHEAARAKIDEEADAEVQRIAHLMRMKERNTPAPETAPPSGPQEVPAGGWKTAAEVLDEVEQKIDEGYALARKGMDVEQYREFAMYTAHLRAFVLVVREGPSDKGLLR